MIAAIAVQRIAAGFPPSDIGFGADSTLPVTTIQA
jgi:N6-L-threonylcarbamoyladenine synthase